MREERVKTRGLYNSRYYRATRSRLTLVTTVTVYSVVCYEP